MATQPAWTQPSKLRTTKSRLTRLLRATPTRLALLLAFIVALYFGLTTLHTNVLARLHLHRHLSWYGLGLYGLAPSQRVESLDSPVPLLEYPRWDSRCSQDYVFFGWRGHNVAEPGAVILDAQGELIWRQTGSQIDQNDVRTQMYRGERFLTFQMDGDGGNQSEGYWYMMDSSYTVRYRLRPGNGLPHADMHEFQLTDDDTALVISTVPVQYDLSNIGGSKEGWIEDCYFQELDIETGAVLFQWHSLDYFAPNTTMEVQNNCHIDPRARFAGCGDDEGSSFDYFHLNSVQKDSKGNYLLSARNIWGIIYVSGTTGEVLWTLGAGTSNDFTDLSDSNDEVAALDFAWQHHARWVQEGVSLSFFDNHYHRIGDAPGPSGGRILDLDVANRSVKLRTALTHPNHIRPESQGNTQRLGNGNYMVGWGSSGGFTEFGADGEVLCDGRFGAEAFFEFSPVSSYRVFRGEWIGMPAYPPSVAVVGNKAYVSWNGATEVARWQVESLPSDEEVEGLLGDVTDGLLGVVTGRSFWKQPQQKQQQDDNSEQQEGYDEEENGQVEILAQEYRTGFETVIDLPKAAANARIRIVALSEGGERIGATDWLEVPDWSVLGLAPLFVMIISLLAVFLTAVLGAVLWWTCVCRRSKARAGGEYLQLGENGEEEEEEEREWKDQLDVELHDDGQISDIELDARPPPRHVRHRSRGG